jgi:glycosyltransferase involved in cell wall biosynthesis
VATDPDATFGCGPASKLAVLTSRNDRRIELAKVGPKAESLEAKATAAESIRVGLLTGGGDKHYAVPLAAALGSKGIRLDFIGSDQLDCEEVRGIPGLRFLNLRGDQREDAGAVRKVIRILKYYMRLLQYAAGSDCQILHVLWNNKFEFFDRTLLMVYYRILGKRIAFTAHNVNAAVRDSKDNWLNRFSLRVQYRLCHLILVHTQLMKQELVDDFGVRPDAVRVIPYGINNAVPVSGLTASEARTRLALTSSDRTVLFFGKIAPYKGLEYLVDAMRILAVKENRIRLVVAGPVKPGYSEYWNGIERQIQSAGLGDLVVRRIEFIPDEHIEGYFKAADVAVLPYTYIFQSGVLFLAYGFGVPVIATDVGSLREDVVDGRTGFVCAPRDATALAKTLEQYFRSDLYQNLDDRRHQIRSVVSEEHSWARVAEIVSRSYLEIAGVPMVPRVAVDGRS